MRKKMIVATGLVAGLAVALVTALPAAADWEAGTAAFKAGNYAGALQEFQAVAEAQPEWPGGHLMLGQTLLKLKRNKEAVAALEQANRIDPSNAGYQLPLGQAYVQTGRYADAARVLGAIDTGKVPKAQQAVLNQLLALAQSKTGDTDGALRTLSKAAAASPSDAGIQYQYGTAALNAGQTANAVAALEKAVQLDASPEKQKVLAQALIRRARETKGASKVNLYQKATSAAQSLAGNQPTYDNLLLLGEAQLGAKNYPAAIKSFEQASQKNAGDWYSFYYLGQAHTATATYPTAVTSLKQALSKTSSSDNQKKVYKQLGFVYEKQKAFSDAESAYRSAGDSTAANRVAENARIASENQAIDADNSQIDALAAERAKLEAELKALEDGGGLR